MLADYISYTNEGLNKTLTSQRLGHSWEVLARVSGLKLVRGGGNLTGPGLGLDLVCKRQKAVKLIKAGEASKHLP